jgi:MFS family permease
LPQLQGVGAGGIDVMVDIITVDLVPLKKRAKYTAFIQMSGAFGMVSGMIFGATLVQKASWRL